MSEIAETLACITLHILAGDTCKLHASLLESACTSHSVQNITAMIAA